MVVFLPWHLRAVGNRFFFFNGFRALRGEGVSMKSIKNPQKRRKISSMHAQHHTLFWFSSPLTCHRRNSLPSIFHFRFIDSTDLKMAAKRYAIWLVERKQLRNDIFIWLNPELSDSRLENHYSFYRLQIFWKIKVEKPHPIFILFILLLFLVWSVV